MDLLSFIALLALISTGAVLKFTLPPRSSGASIWGLTRHEWADVHFYISVTFLIIISFHLFLHIKYIKKAVLGSASREHNYRLLIGAVSIIVLLLLLIAPVIAPVDSQERSGSGQYYEQRK